MPVKRGIVTCLSNTVKLSFGVHKYLTDPNSRCFKWNQNSLVFTLLERIHMLGITGDLVTHFRDFIVWEFTMRELFEWIHILVVTSLQIMGITSPLPKFTFWELIWTFGKVGYNAPFLSFNLKVSGLCSSLNVISFLLWTLYYIW